MTAEVAIRLDTEDFLTPASDDALASILDILGRHDATATFPLVAAKLRHWQRHRRDDLIERLHRHAVGYHSATHSLHPTIAEELAPLPWPEAQEAFRRREAEGLGEVQAVFGPAACWTQPGGNWTAAALPVLRSWGVPMEFSESWNSYLDVGDRPCHYGGLLHWSPPVSVPKPFLSGLPACLDQALGMVGASLADRRSDAPPVCIVAHPTELCTTAFWDAENFARGRMPDRSAWRAAPLRDPQAIATATEALDRFLGALKAMRVGFVTASDLAARYPDRARALRVPPAAFPALAACVRERAGWVTRGDLALSAAELLGLLAAAVSRPEAVSGVRWCDGPAEAAPPDCVTGSVSRPDLLAAARWCDRWIGERHALPSAVPCARGALAPADLLAALAQLILEPATDAVPIRPTPVAAAQYVKPPARLHWDWPIFPEGFAPFGLWEQARLQSWTFKPACPHDGRQGAWAPAQP